MSHLCVRRANIRRFDIAARKSRPALRPRAFTPSPRPAIRRSQHVTETQMMKYAVLLAALGGIALALWLVVTNDTSVILHAFAAVGWGLVAMVAVRGVILLTCGTAWATLLRRLNPPPMRALQVVRFIREAVNVLLPVATVGGDILGARLITFWGLKPGLAGASILVDLLLQASGQAVFALMGALLLAQVAGAAGLVDWVLGGLGIAAIGLLGFLVVQHSGAVGSIERAIAWLVRKLARSGAVGAPLGLDAGLKAIWADPAGVAISFVLHIIAWLLGVAEIWIALYCMGHPVSLADAAIIESLGQALRGAAFPVPGALGVQEGGFVVHGQLLGIDPGTAIALSFAKRVPDIVLGLPGLFGWHLLESRRKPTMAALALED